MELRCLRCDNVVLDRVSGTGLENFRNCSSCGHHFLFTTRGKPVEEWFDPVSIVLYRALHARDPLDRVPEVAVHLATYRRRRKPFEVRGFRRWLVNGRPRAHRTELEHQHYLDWLLDAVQCELDQPSQRVSDLIYPGQHPEDVLRDYLVLVTQEVRSIR